MFYQIQVIPSRGWSIARNRSQGLPDDSVWVFPSENQSPDEMIGIGDDLESALLDAGIPPEEIEASISEMEWR